MKQFQSGDHMRWELYEDECQSLRQQCEAIDRSGLSRFDATLLAAMTTRLSRDFCTISDRQLCWLTDILERHDTPDRVARNDAEVLRAQIAKIIAGESL